MTAARMRVTNSSRETTCLPIRWPQRFVCTWSSMWHAARPARMYFCTVRATIAGPPKLRDRVSVCVHEGDYGLHIPSVGISDDGHAWVERRVHGASLNEVVQGGDGEVGHAKARSSGGSAAGDYHCQCHVRNANRICQPLVQAVKASLESAACADAIANAGGNLR